MFAMLPRRRQRLFAFLFVSSYITLILYAWNSVMVITRHYNIQRIYSTNISFKDAGVIDKTSQWQKLGRATYLFTAYLDDRGPHYDQITVMGLDSHSEPLLNGTLLFYGGEKLPLGSCKEKRGLNDKGSLKRLQPYAYDWPLPTQVTNATYLSLRSILVQQFHPMEGPARTKTDEIASKDFEIEIFSTSGKTEAEIQIRLPAHSSKTFGVCIDSPLFGPVKAKTVIENIEINKVLGAEWFTFYIYEADQTVTEALKQYASDGTVEVVQNWGKGFPRKSAPHFGQTLSINECAYRNMYRVKYLVYTDLDEFIVPRKSIGWTGMMNQMENDKYGYYIFRNAFFFEGNNKSGINTGEHNVVFSQNRTCGDELPKFLTHGFRSDKIWEAGRRSKYILNPLCFSVLLVHQVRGRCPRYVVPPDYALLNHYRKFRKGKLPLLEDVSSLIPDKSAFVYQEEIVKGLNKRLCRPKSIASR